MKLMLRHEVPVDETWDLTLMYKDEAAIYEDVEKMQSISREIVDNYRGKLSQASVICACMEKYEALAVMMSCLENYAELVVSVDYYNSHNQELSSKIAQAVAKVRSETSFVRSEILTQSEDVLFEAISNAKHGRLYLMDMARMQPHMLHPEAEKLLAAMAQTVAAPYEVYNNLKLADMQFDNFEVNGKSYPLGYSLFEDDYEYEPDTAIRRKAFEAFSKKIKAYENGTACAYNAYLQHEKLMADLRGFDSIWEKDLFDQKVTMEMYNRQIDLIMEKLAPHMRKYAKYIQRIHGLDRMTYADLKLPVDPSYCPPVTIEESKDYIEKGLAILGEDYLDIVRTGYKERWVDFAKNQGKSTGGFCCTPYGKTAFILLDWNEKMSDVFTLAHEYGHAGHFMLCNEAQSVFDTEVSTYFVEAPSTMNELLMGHYLLKTNEDPRFRRWVLSNMVSNTYYHNFVTHLLEAAYQREVYRIIDQGGSVQAETLSKIMMDVLKQFWGDAVELNEGAELTWMRQPHYYMGLYSYTYSAGLTVATQMCKRIEKEGQTAVEDWKKVLLAGGTLDPVGLAALGGVDITTDDALLDTIETIGAYIDEICKYGQEI